METNSPDEVKEKTKTLAKAYEVEIKGLQMQQELLENDPEIMAYFECINEINALELDKNYEDVFERL